MSQSDKKLILVLGAGFSRAVSNKMPTTADLNALVWKTCSDDEKKTFPNLYRDDLEGLLDFLITEQPYLQDYENLQNKALFAKLARVIYEEIWSKELEVIKTIPPRWLTEFGDFIKQRFDRICVITLNYDCLLERSIGTPRGYSKGKYGFNLCKLHGSTDRFCSGNIGDSSGNIYHVDELAGWNSVEPTREPDDVRREKEKCREYLYDKNPVIIPPTTVKNSLLAGRVVLEDWRKAAEAIENATAICFLGYSLTEADKSFRSLITHKIRGGSTLTVVSANLNESHRERARSLLPDRNHIERDTILAFVEDVLPTLLKT